MLAWLGQAKYGAFTKPYDSHFIVCQQRVHCNRLLFVAVAVWVTLLRLLFMLLGLAAHCC